VHLYLNKAGRGSITIMVFVLLWLLLPLAQYAQGQSPALDSTRIKKDTTSVPVNPFDIQPVGSPSKLDSQATDTGQGPTFIKKIVKGVNKPEKSQNFLFVLSMIILGFMSILVSLNRSLVVRIFRSLANENFLKLLYRNQTNTTRVALLLFYILFAMSFGLFLYQVIRKFGYLTDINQLMLYGICLGGIIVIYGIKHIALTVIGSVFPLEKETSLFNFTVMLFNITNGLLLMPVNILIAFGPEEIVLPAIYAGGIIFVVNYILRQLRGLFIAGHYIGTYNFHFFVYLCTVEIAPIVVLLRLIKMLIGF